MKRSYIVADHVGAPEMRHVAAALSEGGLLREYVTSFPNGRPSRWLAGGTHLLPRSAKRAVASELRRRAITGEPAPLNSAHSGETYEILAALANKARCRNVARHLQHRRGRSIDQQVSREMRSADACTAVVARTGWASWIFEQSRSDAIKILDVAAAPPQHQREMLRKHGRSSRDQVWPAHLSSAAIRDYSREVELADVLLCYSRYHIDVVCAHNDVVNKSIWEIPLGVDTWRFRPGIAGKSVANDGGRVRLLFAGRETEAKGAGQLAAALSLLSDSSFELTVVGSLAGGPLSDLANRKLPRQHRDRLPELYRGSDIFVAPSLSDSFGLTVLEAMACGVPVICSTNTGIADTVQLAGAGRVVPVGDPAALAEAIESLGDSPDLRRQMGAAGRDAADKLTWDHFMSNVVESACRL
jgi:glycosyltransferase involved in cell wall biosynthesis